MGRTAHVRDLQQADVRVRGPILPGHPPLAPHDEEEIAEAAAAIHARARGQLPPLRATKAPELFASPAKANLHWRPGPPGWQCWRGDGVSIVPAAALWRWGGCWWARLASDPRETKRQLSRSREQAMAEVEELLATTGDAQ